MKIRKSVAEIKAYVPGKSIQSVKQELDLENVIKLASNENPFGPPLSANDIQDAFSEIHHYPHQESSPLYAEMAHKNDVSTNQILFGNGSDDLLYLAALCCTEPGEEIITSSQTFSVYKSVSQLLNAKFIQVPLSSHYKYDISAIIKAVTPLTRVIFIANPNNPTGTILTHHEITTLMDAISSDVLVVLDQAYAEFVEESDYPVQKELLTNYKNIFITGTFSKLYGLAGLRIGWGIGHPELIEQLQKIRQPFNVNALALRAASIALKNIQYQSKTLENNRLQKSNLYHFFDSNNIEYIRSEANFVMFFHENAKDLTNNLLKNGVIVRHLASFGLDNAIRVSLGLPEEMSRFTTLLAHYLEENK